MQLFINGWGLAAGAQRSVCLPRVNGRLNPGLIHRRSRIPNKHAHSWRVEINSFLSFALFSNSALKNCFLFSVLCAEVDIEGMEFTPGEADSVDSISDGEEEEEDHYSLQSSSSDTSYTATHSHRLQPHHC